MVILAWLTELWRIYARWTRDEYQFLWRRASHVEPWPVVSILSIAIPIYLLLGLLRIAWPTLKSVRRVRRFQRHFGRLGSLSRTQRRAILNNSWLRDSRSVTPGLEAKPFGTACCWRGWWMRMARGGPTS